MNALLAIIFLALIAKDTSRLGDPYVFRAITQTGCLLVAMYFFVIRIKELSLNKYWLLFSFFLSLMIGSLLSSSLIYSGLQTISLMACVFFFIAYHEMSNGIEDHKGIYIVIKVLLILMVLSLAIMKIFPSIAYYYNPLEGFQRFRGLFANPEALAASAGISWGLLAYAKRSQISRPLRIGGMVISFICIIAAMCRTYWLAWLVATSVVVVWSSYSIPLRWKLFSALFAILVSTLFVFTDFTLLVPNVEKYVRSKSISNMSGRVAVWESALEKVRQRPAFGYGFGAGDDAFKQHGKIIIGESSNRFRATMHNGYIQALLDSGVIGFILYLAINLMALYRILFQRNKDLAPALYVCLFMTVANMGQSSLFAAASHNSLIGWFYIVFALSVRRKDGQERDIFPQKMLSTTSTRRILASSSGAN